MMFAASPPARQPRRTGRRLLPLVAAAILAAAPARAELDAESLQAKVQKVVDEYVALSEGTLQPQGKVEAVADGDAVVVTTPAMQVVGPDTRIDVPSSVVRLQENDAGHVAFTLTLPSRITGVKQGPPEDKLTIDIGGQRIEGIYLPKLLTFERLDLQLDNIAASVNDGAFDLGALRVNMTNVENEGGKWRSDAAMSMGPLRVFGPDKAEMMSIGRIENGWRIDHYDLPAFAEIQRRLSGGNPLLGVPKPDDAETQAAMQELVQRLPELFDGASGGTSFGLADLKVAAVASPAFGLGSAKFDIGLAPEEALYGLRFLLAVDEPAVDPGGSPVPPNLLPRRAVADAGLRKLPLGQLWEMVSVPLQQAMDLELQGTMTPEAQAEIDQQLEMVPFAAMGMAGEAGSFAEIRQIEVEVGPARLSIAGVGPLMPGMPEPALNVMAKIEGLDALAEEVQKLGPPMSEEVLPVLVMLKGLGKAEAVNDQVVYTYLVAQGPQGEVTVNGVNVEELEPK